MKIDGSVSPLNVLGGTRLCFSVWGETALKRISNLSDQGNVCISLDSNLLGSADGVGNLERCVSWFCLCSLSIYSVQSALIHHISSLLCLMTLSQPHPVSSYP